MICKELEKESVRQKVLIENWEVKEGNFIRPEAAAAVEAPFEPFDARTRTALYWNRPVASVEECSGLEEKQADAPFTALENGGAEIPFVIKPYEIKSFRIREK